MPLNALGWSNEEDEALVELVKPQTSLYNILDPSRKNILVRESAWQEIAQVLSKPVEECKKRWRGLRDFYMRTKRVGAVHKTKTDILEKLEFLDVFEENAGKCKEEIVCEPELDEASTTTQEEKVITDNQEYYEITVLDGAISAQKPPILIQKTKSEVPQKRGRGRKKTLPMPNNIPPVKILPKPMIVNNPKLLRYVEEEKTPAQRSQVIDKLIEKVLKENTNEIDVFFRSMAASVKKLQPNLIPKVKMEVCSVIAKYEMQSFDKNMQNF